MTYPIYPCIWYNNQAKEAAEFYSNIFPNSSILSENPQVVMFSLAGRKIMGLNGGPMFTTNPSISLFINCQKIEDVDTIWNQLIIGGKPMMDLDTYPWAEKYGWVVDQFGMSWQIMVNSHALQPIEINPSMLFVGEQYGKAITAIEHYTQLFPNSEIFHLETYQKGEGQPVGTLKFGHYQLNGELFSAMDGFGAHEFQFNEGVSFVVECDTQQEIDHYWDVLTKNGTPIQCGWLKDEFGVSWQVIPTILKDLMADPLKAPKVVEAFMKMTKFEIEPLLNIS